MVDSTFHQRYEELRSLKSQLSKDNFIKDLVDMENNAMKFVIFVASCANEFENSPDKPPDFQACIDEIADKLNQELLAYEDTFHDDVCGTSKTWLQKLRIVAIKGMLKGNENQYLEDCIQCLSNTISSLQVLEDIKIAIGLWVKIVTPNGTSEEEHFQASNNMINLLHSVTDLLSVKVELHDGLSAQEKLLAVLWECRMTRHALCISPVNEAFFTSLEDSFFDKTAKSIEFWRERLRETPLLIGFQHTLDITELERKVQDAASTSNIPAFYLCYELSQKFILKGNMAKFGIAHEVMGNGRVAEFYFLRGERIACKQELLLFMIAFSSALGMK
ncbi:hypothetical protein CsatB_027197 [Cannabis sativa]